MITKAGARNNRAKRGTESRAERGEAKMQSGVNKLRSQFIKFVFYICFQLCVLDSYTTNPFHAVVMLVSVRLWGVSGYF